MKLPSFLSVCVLFLAFSLAGFARATDGPDQVGGFVLGDSVDKYKEKVDLTSALPIRYAEYLRQVVIREVPGFKTGQIYYGACKYPGKILRIRLKYSDSSKAFFDELLERIQRRYGKASEWRGDPFGVVIAWKWSLTTRDGRHVSMIVQHNSLDEDEAKGNTIKMALTEMLDDERSCYLKAHPEEAKDLGDDQGEAAKLTPNEWSLLVPR